MKASRAARAYGRSFNQRLDAWSSEAAMADRRYLIVNADDFGQSRGINQGVVEAYESGIVTSASLMVRWPAAAEAAAFACGRPTLSLGLHIDLGEWKRSGNAWVSAYEVVSLEDKSALETEVRRQLGEFRRLVGTDPSHLDSHQHVHRSGAVLEATRTLATELDVPLRHCSAGIHYCGDFYGQHSDGTPTPDRLEVDFLLKLLARLPAGVTELACHPARQVEIPTMYQSERERELETLCEQSVRTAIAELEIELLSFAALPQRIRDNGS